MSKKISASQLLGKKNQGPEKLSVLAFDSLHEWLDECAEKHEFDVDFELPDDYINLMVYFLRCAGSQRVKSEAINFILKAFENFPHLVDTFIAHGFTSPFITIIKNLFLHDECHCDWYPIIMITRYVVMMSSEFRDKIVNAGIVECIIPNSKNYMFSVSMFVGSLFPPFCVEQPADVFKRFLPLFEHFFKIDELQHANLVLSCIMTTPMDNDHVDMLMGHGVMSYLENLRESNVKRISRNAMKFVNEVNVASLLDGAQWIFNEH